MKRRRSSEMKMLGTAFLLVMVTLAAAAAGERENEAEKSVQQWLLLIDRGKFEQSWDVAGAYLQHASTKDVWIRKMDSMRKPLGDVRSRKVKTSLYQEADQTLRADHVRIEFNSSFANKPTAVETATMELEKDGTWKIAGYYIQ
ncbi:MAG TPA: DUF4019 domain-containing protein [Chthoniobacterales bacterium]|jgi:hypothetical protein